MIRELFPKMQNFSSIKWSIHPIYPRSLSNLSWIKPSPSLLFAQVNEFPLNLMFPISIFEINYLNTPKLPSYLSLPPLFSSFPFISLKSPQCSIYHPRPVSYPAKIPTASVSPWPLYSYTQTLSKSTHLLFTIYQHFQTKIRFIKLFYCYILRLSH